MPQLIFKGVKESDVKSLSKTLSKDLSKLMDTPVDWFVFEHVEASFFVNGESTKLYPMVEVKWFCRGEDIKNKTAVIINNELNKLNYKETEVFFYEHKKENYYENGEHY